MALWGCLGALLSLLLASAHAGTWFTLSLPFLPNISGLEIQPPLIVTAQSPALVVLYCGASLRDCLENQKVGSLRSEAAPSSAQRDAVLKKKKKIR